MGSSQEHRQVQVALSSLPSLPTPHISAAGSNFPCQTLYLSSKFHPVHCQQQLQGSIKQHPRIPLIIYQKSSQLPGNFSRFGVSDTSWSQDSMPTRSQYMSKANLPKLWYPGYDTDCLHVLGILNWLDKSIDCMIDFLSDNQDRIPYVLRRSHWYQWLRSHSFRMMKLFVTFLSPLYSILDGIPRQSPIQTNPDLLASTQAASALLV